MAHILRILLPLILISQFAALASAGDWVLEKRFTDQLAKANSGDALAMYEVGRMYERGRGTTTDLKIALEWYEKAADGGSNQAQARLGMFYFKGQATKQDYAEAYKHLSKAAKANVPSAQYFLAIMLENGNGVATDLSRAEDLYKKAAAGGFYQASNRLAELKKRTRQSQAILPTPPDPKPVVQARTTQNKLAKGLAEVIMQGDWQRNGKPAGFLPSSKTKCRQQSKRTYKCQSKILTRSANGKVINYVTFSTIESLSKEDQINISYYNNIMSMHKEGEEPKEQDDSEDFSVARTHSEKLITTGRQHMTHAVKCKIGEEKTLVCIKNRTIKLEFSDKSGRL